MWARIQDNIVFEIIDFNPDGNFHPSLVWVECDANVQQGWSYSDGVFAPPPGPSREFARDHIKDLIEISKEAEKQLPFVYNGHNYYADKNSIESTLNIGRDLPSTDPIPTPAPITGYWKSADFEADGVTPIMVAFTNEQFRLLAKAYYDRDANLWMVAEQHKGNVDTLYYDPSKTAQDILNYDYTLGW